MVSDAPMPHTNRLPIPGTADPQRFGQRGQAQLRVYHKSEKYLDAYLRTGLKTALELRVCKAPGVGASLFED
jgi:hypothetical protein